MTQPEGSKSSHLSGIVITGIFGIIIACVTGAFLLINTLIQNGIIAIGPSIQAGNPNSQPTIIVVTATSQIDQPNLMPVSTQSSFGKCPSTADAAASMFGGSVAYWKRLEGFEQNAWKYGPAPAAPIKDINIPEGMKGDWWDNFKAHSQVGPVNGGFATEATIWCAP